MSKPTKLYRHFDASDVLLYVGISINALHRLAQHEVDKEWQDQIATIKIETHQTREAALEAERKAIANENPIHNKLRYDKTSLDDWEQRDGSMRIPRLKKFGDRTIISHITISAEDWASFSANLDRVMKNAQALRRVA